jgi:hypothetical protein
MALEAIEKALAGAGVKFLPDDGKGGPGLRIKVRRLDKK